MKKFDGERMWSYESYIRENENLELDGFKVENIIYHFGAVSHSFHGVKITMDWISFAALKNIYEEKFSFSRSYKNFYKYLLFDYYMENCWIIVKVDENEKSSYLEEIAKNEKAEKDRIKNLNLENIKQKKENAKRLAKIKEQPLYIQELIKKKQFCIGMNKEQVILSLGNPYDINRTVGSWGIHEQWIYRWGRIYLYFENGILTSFQD